MPEINIRSLKIPIEVAVFFLLFSFLISGTITGNLVIYRTCYVTLGYTKSDCALLGSNNPDNSTANLEKLVQPHSAIINMVSALTENLSSVFVCLFVGPWSDRFGRKPMLILPLVGYLLSNILLSMFSVIEYASPWFLLLCHLPVVLCGGTPSYFTVLLCYVTDITSETNRGMRMAFLEGSIFSGMFLGTILSSFIFEATGYAIVFLLAAICCSLSLFITVFFVSESLVHTETEGHLKGFFRISNMTDMLKVTFKKRQHYGRFIILSCVVMTMLSVLASGDSVMYLYLRQKFHWSLQKYTLYNAIFNVVPVIGTIVGVYLLHKVLKISENILILIAVASSFGSALVMGLAQSDWMVYIAGIVKIGGGLYGPMLQSLVSKLVPKSETGKILSLVIACQFLFTIVATPLYTSVYNSTIDTNPGIFNFVSAGFQCALMVTTIGVLVARRKAGDNYDHLIEDLGETQSVTT